jgi:hypothetical protein
VEKRNSYRLLVGEPEGNKPLGRPRHRCVDNIKIDVGEMGSGGMNWIGLVQDNSKWRALMNVVMNLQVPYNAGNFLSGCKTGGLSSSAQLHRVIR